MRYYAMSKIEKKVFTSAKKTIAKVRTLRNNLKAGKKDPKTLYKQYCALARATKEWNYHGWWNNREYWLRQSEQYYLKAIHICPTALLYWELGSVLSMNNEHQRSVQAFTQALQLQPGNMSTILKDRGNAYCHLKQYEKALADYNEAIRIDPNNVYAYWGRSATFNAMQDIDKAIADITQMIDIDRRSYYWFVLRARYYVRKELYDAAIADYKEAINLGGRHYLWLYIDRAEIYIKANEYDLARADLEEFAHRCQAEGSDLIIGPGVFIRGGALCQLIIEKEKTLEA